ncbi:MAG TPA: hypothetical protein VHL59_15320 [Thermoanaerobaculia bacterium]|nr:hypothetical protein [Thermoanaerobaculia bacterium]
MTRRSLVILLLLVCTGCKETQKQPAAPKSAGGPRVRATVVTIRTTIQPANQTSNQTIVIAGDKARNTGELDVWRIFDMKANTVTYVDDTARTIRTEELSAILQKRRAALAGALPPHYPRVRLARTGQQKAILGVKADEHVMKLGAYKRELWLAEAPAIPAGLFAMMLASDGPSSPLAPMMRSVDDALTRTRAFPLLDRTELPHGKDKLVVERAVTAIAQREVPAAILEPPRGYRDLTLPKKPAAAP